MSGFSKLFATIIASSVWTEDHATVRVWITLLALKSAEGVVEGSVPGLARLANVTRLECEVALAKFLAPDPDSRDLELHPEREGRRIAKVPGGWAVLNHEFYRDMQGSHEYSMSPEAIRKRRWRQQKKAGDAPGHIGTGGDSGVTPSASASVSVSVVDLEGEVQEREREAARSAVGDFVSEHDFGPFVGSVEGLLRSQRFPLSVASTLRMHLAGEMDHERCSPIELGRACQEFLPKAEGRWDAAYFAGFVRRAKGKIAQARETKRIEVESAEKAERARDDESAATVRRAAVSQFETTHPARHAALQRQAEAEVDPKFTRGRGVLVRARLIELVRQELGHAE